MHCRILALLALALCAKGFASEPPAFIGPIPVQRVAPDTPLVIDMHRFYQATPESKLEIAKVDGAEVTFDPAKFELTVTAR